MLILKTCDKWKTKRKIRCLICDKLFKEGERMVYCYGWFHGSCFMDELNDMFKRQTETGEDVYMIDFHERLNE